MAVILSHPTGNANVKAVADGLYDSGLLRNFTTSIASFPGSFLDKISSFRPLSEIKRRSFDPRLRSLTQMWPWPEGARILALKAGITKFTEHEKGYFCIDAVYRSLDKFVANNLHKLSKQGTNAIYAYEDGAYSSFIEAKKLGFHCFYDLPIGYWREGKRLLDKERINKPEWAATLIGLQDSEIKLARKDKELILADRIFVASQFTANTLKAFPGTLAPIEVIPYGFPPVVANRNYFTKTDKAPLKLLFVGGLSQRKGIADLFSAVDVLKNHVTLTIVGHKASNNCPALDAALNKHKWIPSLPHADILILMQAHDVLVFPSLFEGFGLVITEAMSQGTPVITTDRTAGPDLIEHGHNGWLIEAGSSNAIQTTLEQIIRNPAIVKSNGMAARETAIKRPWEVYGREVAEAILKS